MPILYSAASATFDEAKRKVQPKLTDNDRGVITATVNGRRVRDWIYANNEQRRHYMVLAREYVEGWCDGRDFL